MGNTNLYTTNEEPPQQGPDPPTVVCGRTHQLPLLIYYSIISIKLTLNLYQFSQKFTSTPQNDLNTDSHIQIKSKHI